MALLSEEIIKNRSQDLKLKIDYLQSFLNECLKGSNAKEQVAKELHVFRKEYDILLWVLNDEIPF